MSISMGWIRLQIQTLMAGRGSWNVLGFEQKKTLEDDFIEHIPLLGLLDLQPGFLQYP